MINFDEIMREKADKHEYITVHFDSDAVYTHIGFSVTDFYKTDNGYCIEGDNDEVVDFSVESISCDDDIFDIETKNGVIRIQV